MQEQPRTMNADDDLIPTRESLLRRIKDWDDQTSWTEFFETYWRLIFKVARKAGLNDHEAQDVVQETLLSLAKQMPESRYEPEKGSFKAYLLRLTRWRIVDQFRKRPREQLESELASDSRSTANSIELSADVSGSQLDGIWDVEWQQNLASVALDRLKQRVNPKHYQLFDLFALKNWPVDRIVDTMGVTAHQVYTAKSRVSSLLRKEIELLQRRELSGIPNIRRKPPN